MIKRSLFSLALAQLRDFSFGELVPTFRGSYFFLLLNFPDPIDCCRIRLELRLRTKDDSNTEHGDHRYLDSA